MRVRRISPDGVVITLREIKEAGGITIAQSPDTAEWSDMPANAIKTVTDRTLVCPMSQRFSSEITRWTRGSSSEADSFCPFRIVTSCL